jgi:ABC-type branched-subunit amino acid transport system substrate-binding protein/serine/threonine protein kinase
LVQYAHVTALSSFRACERFGRSRDNSEEAMERSTVISFAEEDMAYVTGLRQGLEQELSTYAVTNPGEGERSQSPVVWIYPDQPGGVRIHSQISERISQALAVVVVLTEHSAKSEWVLEEVEWALSEAKNKRRLPALDEQGLPIITLAIGDQEALRKTKIGRLLSSSVWIDPANLNARHANEAGALVEALEAVRPPIIEAAVIVDKLVLGERITRRLYGGIRAGTYDQVPVIVKEIRSVNREVLRALDERVAQRRRGGHLDLPQIVGYISRDDRRYVIMEEIRGRSMGEQVTRSKRPFTWEELKPTAERVIQTLMALHGQGILHLGIKPENLKRQGDRVRLLDLGFDQQPVGSASGTPDPYLAPEQLDDSAADVQTDIYALGATLYTLLTGDTQPNAAKPPAHRRQRGIPDHVGLAIHQAMQPTPSKRFASALDMLNALVKRGPDPDLWWLRYAVGAAAVVAVAAISLAFLGNWPGPSVSGVSGATSVPTAPTTQTTEPLPVAQGATGPAGTAPVGPSPTPVTPTITPTSADSDGAGQPRLLEKLRDPQPGKSVYRIVVPIPLTGEFAERAKGMEIATTMVIDDLASGRLSRLKDELLELGIELQINMVDDKGNEEIPVQLAEEIMQTGDTRCLAGHYRSLSTIAAANTYKQREYPLLVINSTSTNPGVTGIMDTLWRIITTDTQQGRRAYEVSQQIKKGSGKIALVRTEDMNDPFTNDVIAAFETAAGSNSLFYDTPAKFPRGAKSDADFQAAAEVIKNIQFPPALIFFIGTNVQLETFLRQLPESYKDVPILGVSLMDNIEAIKTLRQAGWSITYTAAGVPKEPEFDLMAQWFVNDFDTTGRGTTLAAYAAETYDAIYLCVNAIRQAAVEQKTNVLSVEEVSGVMDTVFASTFPKTEDENNIRGTAAGSYIMDLEERELSQWLIVVRGQTETGADVSSADFCNADGCENYKTLREEPIQ